MGATQPKILKLLSFVQMWKFFSHYGVRALLVLYMVQSLRFSDSYAFGINAMFCGLVELGGIFGGVIADRYLGLRRATAIGGWLLWIGYWGLIFEKGLFLSLGLVILGGSLFSSNISAILGSAYTENDPRRKKGFVIFYMMQNLGAMVSTFLCGVIAIYYGFKIGFTVAASGMLIGNLAFLLRRDLLPQTKPISKKKPSLITLILLPLFLLAIGLSTVAVSYEGIMLPLLPWITAAFFLFFARKLWKDPNVPKKFCRQLFIYLGALILFFAASDQICSSLIVFAERETNRSIFGWLIPSSVIMSINPVIIILFGTLVAKMRSKLMLPFILLSVSFGGLSFLCLFHFGLSIFGVLGMVMILSLAELMVGPVVSSYASEVAAKGNPGMVMGMVPIAFSLAFLLGGAFSKMVAIDENVSSLAVYGAGFGKIALVTLGGGLILQLLMKRASYAKSPVC